MMKRLLLIAAAVLGLSAPAMAQTRALPPGEIRANGDITFGNALKLGKREAGKTIITPDTLQILGSGSTGDASTLSVTPNASAPAGTLAHQILSATPAGRKAVEQSDASDLAVRSPGPLARTASQRAADTVNLLDYAKCDGTNERAALIAAIAAVPARGTLFIPPGLTCRFDGTYELTRPITVRADGTTIRIGGGLAAGQDAFFSRASDISFIGGNYELQARVRLFNFLNDQGSIRNILIQNITASNYFYLIVVGRIDLTQNRNSNIRVIGNMGVAPVDQASGTTLFYATDGGLVDGNDFQYALNSSAIGVAEGSKSIIITNNRVRGVTDTAAIVDAGIQLEDCPNSNILIQGNITDHDIWVDDTSHVTVGPNIARRYRITASDKAGDMPAIRVTGGKVGGIIIQKYGSSNLGQRISVDIDGVTLDPAGKLLFGTQIEAAFHAEGPVVGRVTASRIRTISSAGATAVRLSRDAGARYDFLDNDFGTQPHVISGTGGILNERNNTAPLIDGYIYATLGSSPAAQNAWTKLPFTNEAADRNDELSNGSFTPKAAGRYRFNGILTFVPSAAGTQMGARLVKSTSGGSVTEVSRLFLQVSQGTNPEALPFRSVSLQLTPNDTVSIQYFMTGGVSLSTNPALSAVDIDRVQ